MRINLLTYSSRPPPPFPRYMGVPSTNKSWEASFDYDPSTGRVAGFMSPPGRPVKVPFDAEAHGQHRSLRTFKVLSPFPGPKFICFRFRPIWEVSKHSLPALPSSLGYRVPAARGGWEASFNYDPHSGRVAGIMCCTGSSERTQFEEEVRGRYKGALIFRVPLPRPGAKSVTFHFHPL
jgi:hypothetical protein